ncbi:methyl-accepting chemotaxis protein [Desulfocucumis palustris]|uniref:Methyl-accepting chemotaxis protein n=1 Tax=Desulfocucumis palustris TaxID=1898651 RepID=A0A2L2XE50_9FIRM|nr:methyl-accepting chemotaxis protein [Desulfocucumis palustris]GBF34430.1 methyl-accepting chemotaxis protein [Desulfocucumis palustris]
MNKYSKSVVTKLLTPIIILLVISFALLAIVNNYEMKKLVWSGIKTSGTESSKRAAAEIQSYLERYSGMVMALANSREIIDFAKITKERSPKSYQGSDKYVNYLLTIRNVVSKDSNIFNLYFGSENSQTFFDIQEFEVPPDYTCDKRSWYVEGKKANRIYVTKPYIDKVTGKQVVSITAPVYEGNSYLGLFVMDLSLETVDKIVDTVGTYNGGYAFLVAQDGTFLVHPEKKLIMSAKATQIEGEFSKIGSEMVSGKDGWGLSNFNGETLYTFYDPIKLADWSIGVNVPEAEITRPIGNQTKLIIIISVIVGIMWILVVLYFVRRTLIPLGTLNKLFGKAAMGNLAIKINDAGSDEIGQLTNSFNMMITSLRDLVNIILTLSGRLVLHSQELAASSEEVSATVEELAGTTNEVAATSAQGAEIAETAAKESDQVRQVAEEGNLAVQKVVEKINSIALAEQMVAGAIKKLGTQSEQIGKIIETITDIAEQTNLLALNAAIEAARAGEHGRGFAVVAEEVRKLAEQSAGASKGITDLVREIQIGVDEAVYAIENGVKEVDEGVQVTNNAGASLKQIIGAVEKNTKMILEAANGSKQANEGTQQLTASNEQIASSIQQVTSAAQELANIAEELQKTVAKFKVDEA